MFLRGRMPAHTKIQEDSHWFSFSSQWHLVQCRKIVSGLVRTGRRVVICMISQHEVAAGKRNCSDCSPSRRERDESLGPGHFCSKKGETGMGWELWMDEMRNTNWRKTESFYGSLETLFSLTSMSPKVLDYKETEIHIIWSLGWKKNEALSRGVPTGYSISKYLGWLNIFFLSI